MMRFVCLICLLTTAITASSQNNFRQLVLQAQRVSTKYLDSVYGKDAVSKSIRLDKSESTITNDGIKKHTSLKNYLDDFLPTLISFTYDLMYKGDTMHIIGVEISDSLKIVDDPNLVQTNFMDALAWRYAMLGAFKFNYDDVKRFIKAKSIDSFYNEITLNTDFLPKKIIHGDRTFVEALFYWTISVYSKTRYPGDNYITDDEIKEIKIDASTGKIMQDSVMTPIPRYR